MTSYAILKTIEDALCLSRIYVYAIENLVKSTTTLIDDTYRDTKPSYLLLSSFLSFCVILLVTRQLSDFYEATTFENFLKFVRGLPFIRTIVERKINSIGVGIKHELVEIYRNEDFVAKLPEKSMAPEVVLKRVKHYKMFDTSNWQQGRISGAIYTNNSSRLNEILLSVYGSNMWSNPLHADVFAGVRKMESEIVRMVGTMYNGKPDEIVGNVTSGGTESIIMACKAYRDYSVKVRGIRGKPEIVAPVTAHAAFEKAANLLGCKIVHIPVDKKTFKVNVCAMKRAITKNTFMLVGSAPQFPHGIIDPIRSIAKLGKTYGIPVHVDACLGGFLIPFMKLAGHDLDEDFDFTVPGVTSVSADTHKYGYAPKGTSVILYNSKKYIHCQYSIQTDWPGGIYASPTLPGSRPGALIATCWTAMMYHGLEGYVEATDKIIRTTRWIRDELANVEGLKVLGDPKVSVLAFASEKFDIYALNQSLKDLGWNLNALQFPSAFHLCVTLMHTDNKVASSFVRDVKHIVKDLAKGPHSKASGAAAIYGMAQTISDRSLVAEICTKYLDGCLGF